MPELPEVQTVVDSLRPRLVGGAILGMPTLRADIVSPLGFDLPAHLAGRAISDLARRGKRIVFTLDDGNRFYIHLGMTGRLTIEASDAPVLKHTHAIMVIGEKGRRQKAEGRRKTHASGVPNSDSAFCLHPSAVPLDSAFCLLPPAFMTLRFRDPRRFGGIWWLGKDSPAGDMGPEPLLIRPGQLLLRLAGTTRASRVCYWIKRSWRASAISTRMNRFSSPRFIRSRPPINWRKTK